MKRDDEITALGHRFFTPRSIALIGVSADENAFGTLYLKSLLKFGFKGKLYPVNPRRGSIFGLILFPSVRDIPDSVDLAIISVPKRAVPAALEDCVAKGIKAAVVLSAGFSETGEEGKRLEEEMVRVTAKGIRVIGPNCFGLYCPRGGLTVIPGKDFPKESGPVGLVAQSGQLAEMIVLASRGLGIRFSKVVSYGNACDLNEADLVEFLADDPETKIIACYIEGVKQGRRFLEVVRRTLKQKPVLIWKAGLTDSGRRAASSHTGSLAGSEAVWDAFFTQSGAIQIENMEELIDSMIAFNHLLPRCGRRIALLSGSGGSGVIGADVCERSGLELPAFSAEGQKKISSYLPPIIAGVRNPVDLGNPIPPAELLVPVLEAVAGEEQIDTIMMGGMHLSVKGPSLVFGLQKSFEQGREGLREIPVRIKEKYGKPFLMVLNEETSDARPIGMKFEADRRNLRDYYLANGIPVYPTLNQAAKALVNVVKYKERFLQGD
jgi:acyl-CoA synthetase (NDP forming)